MGRVGVIHFDAHADTGYSEFGSLLGHGQPMRRLLESGAVRGDRFVQIGLRRYWPDAETLAWMSGQGMRSYEMAEIVARGLDRCLDEAFATVTDGRDAVFLSVDIDVVDPGMAPGTGTPEPGGFTARQLLDAVRRVARELPLVGADVVEVSPLYDQSDVTATLANRVVLEALSGIARRPGDGEPLGARAAPRAERPAEEVDHLVDRTLGSLRARRTATEDTAPVELLREPTALEAIDHPIDEGGDQARIQVGRDLPLLHPELDELKGALRILAAHECGDRSVD